MGDVPAKGACQALSVTNKTPSSQRTRPHSRLPARLSLARVNMEGGGFAEVNSELGTSRSVWTLVALPPHNQVPQLMAKRQITPS